MPLALPFAPAATLSPTVPQPDKTASYQYESGPYRADRQFNLLSGHFEDELGHHWDAGMHFSVPG
jgi:hypothetical protein